MPRFKVKFFGDPGEDICELEEVKYLFNFTDRIIVVDGQTVYFYDDLVVLVSQEKYKDQEFIEIVQVPMIEGG
jgi:hypothetical protein